MSHVLLRGRATGRDAYSQAAAALTAAILDDMAATLDGRESLDS